MQWRSRKGISEEVKLNFTQGFAAREFPLGGAEIGHKYKCSARGLRSRENKIANPPPKATRSRISPATQVTPWQEISLKP